MREPAALAAVRRAELDYVVRLVADLRSGALTWSREQLTSFLLTGRLGR